MRAYAIYGLMSAFLAFFAELFRPSVVSFGVQSAYARTLLALLTLYCGCVLFWFSRVVCNTCG